MIKFLAEFGPLLAFFTGYKIGGILQATLYMLVISIIGMAAIYIKYKKINNVNLISSILLLVSASLTLFSGNSIFIKMKPTLLYFLFAVIFFVTTFKWKPAIQYVLGHAVYLKAEKNWQQLNLRFMWFFLLMAVLNEIVWRNFSESSWVTFKVFGTIPITIIFIMLQLPFIIRNKHPDSRT